MAALNALGAAVRPAHAQIPPDIAHAADYERHAIHHVEAQAWQHIQGGTDQGLTLAHNRAAFDHVWILNGAASLPDLRPVWSNGHSTLYRVVRQGESG